MRGFLLAALFSFGAGGLLAGYVVWYNYASDEAVEESDADAVTGDEGTAPTMELEASPTPLADALEEIDPENPEETVEAVTRVAEPVSYTHLTLPTKA